LVDETISGAANLPLVEPTNLELTNALVDPATSFVKIGSGVSSAYYLVGIEDNTDGRELIISNETAFAMNIMHNSSAIESGNQGRRIMTPTGSNVTINSFGAARVIYSSSTAGAQGRWLLL
jgi:hypothetical protein